MPDTKNTAPKDDGTIKVNDEIKKLTEVILKIHNKLLDVELEQKINNLRIRQQQKVIDINKKFKKKTILTYCFVIILFSFWFGFPMIFGKKLTCSEYQTATFLEKTPYLFGPIPVSPCDSIYFNRK